SEWSEGGVYLVIPEGTDWSGASSINVDVFVPAEASDFLAQIFTKTGADLSWSNTADIPLVAGEWNTLVGDLSTLGAVGEVFEVGIKVGSGSTAFTGDFLIDNVVIFSADAGESVEVVAGESALLQSFEDEAHGWALADYWAGGTGLALSSEDA